MKSNNELHQWILNRSQVEPLLLSPQHMNLVGQSTGTWEEPETTSGNNAVAVVPVFGVITKGSGLSRKECAEIGICDLDYVTEDLYAAKSDPTTKAIVLFIRSPGGEVVGLKEVSDLITLIRQTIPVISFSDTYECSAAYYLGCNASICLASPSARIGNVGSILSRMSYAESLKKSGIDVYVSASSNVKKFGNEVLPISDEEKADIDRRVKEATNEIVQRVKSNRPLIADENLQAQWFTGEVAVTNGYVDGLIPDIYTVMAVLALP